MKNVKSNIDYLNIYGGSFNATPIGKVIRDIINIDKHVGKQTYYTYNGDLNNSIQISLFTTSSLFYKRFTRFLKLLPYRLKKTVFKTQNFKMITFVILYFLKKALKNNENLIIVYNGQPLILYVLKIILRPKKLIFICHGGSLRVYNKEFGEKEVLKYSNTIVALNEKVFKEVSLIHDDVRFIPNYVNDKHAEINFKKKRSFAYVGRIDTNKRVKEICSIFSKSFKGTDYNLKICGFGASTYFNETIDLIKSSNNIEYLGYLSYDDLKIIYSESKYIILLSSSEGSPLCLNESYPYSIIPIGNTIPGTKDFIEAFGGILLPEEDVFKDLDETFQSIKNNEQSKFYINPNIEKQEKFSKKYFDAEYKSILK